MYTGALTDVLDRHGYRQQTLAADIVPLRAGMRLAGPVYPVLGRPHPGHDYDTSIRRILEMLGSVPTGSVAVYETNERTAAHFGELSATSLASRGCAGAVLDGGARDADYILREDFPVFSRYVTPQDCVVRWELMAHGDVTIVVGGVQVSPGDWIVGDRDGLVVIPGGRLEEIAGRGRGEGRDRERDPRGGPGGRARRSRPTSGTGRSRGELPPTRGRP